MSKLIIKSLGDVYQARGKINELILEGIPPHSIYAIGGKSTLLPLLEYNIEITCDPVDLDADGVDDQIKDLLGDNDQQAIDEYKKDIEQGHVIVLVDDEKVPAEKMDALKEDESMTPQDRQNAGMDTVQNEGMGKSRFEAPSGNQNQNQDQGQSQSQDQTQDQSQNQEQDSEQAQDVFLIEEEIEVTRTPF